MLVPRSANRYYRPWALSTQSAERAGCGLAFNACGTSRTDGAVERIDVGCLLLPDSPSSARRGATMRNASTSISSVDISSSFCLRSS